MSTVPPTSQPKSAPPSGGAAFRIVTPESGEFPPNTDDISTIIPEKHPAGSSEWSHFPGQQLGHFELLEIIGVGGMAAVLKARDLQLGRTVALKILPQQAASNPELLARFQQEARAAALLNDEHVARVYFVGEDRGIHFIAFEYIEGQNLRQIIESRGQLPVNEVIDLMLQIAQGLAHAVERGVVHRDLKPSNIIIDASGCAKIVDMGLARQIDSPAECLTQSGVTMGTYDYVAPEQAIDARSADVRSDIYSLGCTFYHALTGSPPVPDGTAAFKLNFHQNSQPADPRALNPQLPSALIVILGRMMHKSPECRYQNPIELKYDLLAIANQVECTSVASASRNQPSAPRVAFQTFIGTLLASTLLVAILVGWAQIDRSSEVILPGHRTDSHHVKQDETGLSKNNAEIPVRTAATVDELVQLLKEESVSIQLTSSVYEVPIQNSGRLKFGGKKLSLTSRDPARPAVIRWSDRQTQSGKATVPLLDLSGTPTNVTIRGIQFEMHDQIAIQIKDVDALLCDRCVFSKGDGKSSGGQGIVLESKDTMTRLTISNSLFFETSNSIVVRGPALIKAFDSAFVEPDSAFVFDSRGVPEEATANLEHCTIRLARGQAFQFLKASCGTIQMGHCLVAADAATRSEPLAVPALVRSHRAKNDGVDFRTLQSPEGTMLTNAYFGVSWWIDPESELSPAASVGSMPAKIEAIKLPRFPFLAAPSATPRAKIILDPALSELRIHRADGSTYFGVRNNVRGSGG